MPTRAFVPRAPSHPRSTARARRSDPSRTALASRSRRRRHARFHPSRAPLPRRDLSTARGVGSGRFPNVGFRKSTRVHHRPTDPATRPPRDGAPGRRCISEQRNKKKRIRARDEEGDESRSASVRDDRRRRRRTDGDATRRERDATVTVTVTSVGTTTRRVRARRASDLGDERIDRANPEGGRARDGWISSRIDLIFLKSEARDGSARVRRCARGVIDVTRVRTVNDGGIGGGEKR